MTEAERAESNYSIAVAIAVHLSFFFLSLRVSQFSLAHTEIRIKPDTKTAQGVADV